MTCSLFMMSIGHDSCNQDMKIPDIVMDPNSILAMLKMHKGDASLVMSRRFVNASIKLLTNKLKCSFLPSFLQQSSWLLLFPIPHVINPKAKLLCNFLKHARFSPKLKFPSSMKLASKIRTHSIARGMNNKHRPLRCFCKPFNSHKAFRKPSHMLLRPSERLTYSRN